MMNLAMDVKRKNIQTYLDSLWIQGDFQPEYVFYNGVEWNSGSLGKELVIHKNQVSDPIFMVHIVDENNHHPEFNHDIIIEEGCHVFLIECYMGDSSDSKNRTDDRLPQKNNTHRSKIHCKEKSHLQHVILRQGSGRQGSSSSAEQQIFSIEQAEESFYQAIYFASHQTQTKAEISLNGIHAKAEFHTLLLQQDEMKSDIDLTIHHHAEQCESQVIARTVLRDAAKAKIAGKVVVHPTAPGSVAHFETKSLLLSSLSEMQSKPEFEIYHDEVRCTHGAAIGELDKEALFYLRSRGLNEQLAKSLLIKAFIQPILKRISLPNLPRFLEQVEGLLYG